MMSLNDARIKKLLDEWGDVWGVAGLGGCGAVEFSARMTRKLGSCSPSRQRIALNGVLAATENRALAEEVLCHEAAHLAAYILHGRSIKPHGAEWKALMRLAGREPRVRFAADCVKGLKKSPRRRKYSYHHVCGDCGGAFVTARTDHRWRCGICYRKGLSGVLSVTRRRRGIFG